MSILNFTVPATSLRVILLIVTCIAIGAIICLGSLAYCMIAKIQPETVILTAFVGLTGQLVGSLTGLLVNTRTSPGTDSQMPKTDQPPP